MRCTASARRGPNSERKERKKEVSSAWLRLSAAQTKRQGAVGTSQVLQPRPLKAASRPSKPLILIVGVNAGKSCGEGLARFSSWCLFVTAGTADKEKKETATVGNETLRFSTNCGALTHHCVLYSPYVLDASVVGTCSFTKQRWVSRGLVF